MATTTNFGWETPDDTDLVKDGALAIRTLGSAIDTSLVDLKGGTTGQVLSKTSNTDMDFTWVTSDDANAIQNAIVDAKGDLIAASAADTPARLAVGSNNQTIVADSATATGLKYANGSIATLTAKGDLLAASAANVPARLAVGSNDLILVADSTQTTGLKWGGGWTTYTPTLTNITQGNGTVAAAYQIVGKTVFVNFRFDMGTTSAMGTAPRISLPVNSIRNKFGQSGVAADLGTATYVVVTEVNSNKCDFYILNTAATYATWNNITATAPMTWGNGDFLEVSFYYEAA